MPLNPNHPSILLVLSRKEEVSYSLFIVQALLCVFEFRTEFAAANCMQADVTINHQVATPLA